MTPRNDDAFTEAARTFQALAIKGDVSKLAQLCSGELECLEYRYVYPGDYTSTDKEVFEVPVGDKAYRHKLVSWTVSTTSLDATGTKLISSFCHLMKESLRVYGIDVLPQVDSNMLIPISGGGLRAKIASNAQWRVDFRHENDKWLAYRLIVGVH